MPPVAHRHHDGFLMHGEFSVLGEMQASLPCVAKAIGPFAWITVSLVPNIVLCPQPSVLSHFENEFDDICVPFAVYYDLFDI